MIIVAVLWGPHWAGRHVCFNSDNEAVVTIIEKQHAKHLLLTQLLRSLFFFFVAVFHFHFSASHILGVHNVVANAISWDDLVLLSSILPQSTHVTVPPVVAEFLLFIQEWDLPVGQSSYLACFFWPLPFTSRSYKSGVHCYLTLWASYDFTGFPLTELVLCRFVEFLVLEGLSYSSIWQYLCALHHPQLMEGKVDPLFASLHRLHYVLRDCHHSLPSTVCNRRLPITLATLRLIHQLWSTHAGDHDITCLWAASYTGFYGFLNLGEFTCNS